MATCARWNASSRSPRTFTSPRATCAISTRAWIAARRYLKPLGERLFVLPGNHETHEQTKAFCQQHGFVDFHRQARKLNGSNWAGLGYSNITPFKTPGEYSEAEIAAALAPFAGLEKLYLVVHFPPRDTKLDEYAQASTPEAPRCAPGWKRRNLSIYFAGTSTKPRG